MTDPKGWAVFCITKIEDKQPFFFLLRSPFTLLKKDTKFASQLLKLGTREFCWEQSGTFVLKSEAKLCLQQWIRHVVLTDREYLSEAPAPGRPFAPADPYIHRRSPQNVQLDFIRAASSLIEVNAHQRAHYVTNYVPSTEKGPERKTAAEKEATRISRNVRRRARYQA